MELKIEYVPIDSIKPYSKNAKLHPAEQIEQIKKSIQEFGFKDAIAVWNNEVVAGHGRLLAAKELGMKELPIVRLDDLTDEQRRAYALVHNKLTMNSPFDDGILSEELENILDIDMSMFDLGEVFELEPQTVEEDNFQVELPEEPKSKLGDIYQLGEHRLMCGDSTNAEHVAKLMDGAEIELTFTDPPYELKTQGGGILKKSNSMKQIAENGVGSFDPSKLKLYSDTNIYCHNKPLIKAYIELAEANKKPYDLCFYKKTNTPPNYGGHMMTDCEYIAIIGNQSPRSGLDKELYSKCFVGNKDADNELSYSKPVGLCAKFIKLYSRENVLDLFGGSGSTLMACEQLNRKCYMMELSPKYVDVIIRRWEEYTGQKAEKL
jgi:site-specific DNA-methyltransferase (adenine-specific)